MHYKCFIKIGRYYYDYYRNGRKKMTVLTLTLSSANGCPVSALPEFDPSTVTLTKTSGGTEETKDSKAALGEAVATDDTVTYGCQPVAAGNDPVYPYPWNDRLESVRRFSFFHVKHHLITLYSFAVGVYVHEGRQLVRVGPASLHFSRPHRFDAVRGGRQLRPAAAGRGHQHHPGQRLHSGGHLWI